MINCSQTEVEMYLTFGIQILLCLLMLVIEVYVFISAVRNSDSKEMFLIIALFSV